MSISAATSAREILNRLHDVMASRINAQAKLNKVVEVIAEQLSSEVCSIYLLRDGALELYATRGLKQEAVHRSEEHTSELQSLMRISYADFCLKKKTKRHKTPQQHNVKQERHHP